MRTLAIGMDAADSGFVLDSIAAGELPTLGGLVERGAVARLHSQPPFSPEAAWATMMTGCLPGKHGIYNWRAIVPGTNRLVRTPHRTYRQPFWTQLRNGSDPAELLLVDVPYASRLEDHGVTQVLGWGQRGAPRHESWPEGLLGQVIERHGRYPDGLDDEHHGKRRAGRRLLHELQRMTRIRARLTRELMIAHDWDLSVVGFFEPHYGGHAFHRYVDPRTPGHEVGRRWHSTSLLELYRTFDDAVAGLIEAAGPDVNVFVFSGFGMRPNTNGVRALEKVMEGLGYHVPTGTSPAARRTEWLRQAALRGTPPRVRRAIRRRLPEGTSDRHLERLWIEATDWDRTVAYPLSEPGHSFVQLTHPGREDAPEIRQEIAAELRKLTDADTGRPAATEVLVRDEVVSGPNVASLPDLSVVWSQERFLHRLHHPRLGVVDEEVGDLADLKPSEHTEVGFAIAAGPGVRHREGIESGHWADLAATLVHLHGRPLPEEMDGEPLEMLAEDLGPPRREAIDITDGDPWRGL